MSKRYILAVDPGKATGLSYWSYVAGGEPELLWTAEVDENDFAQYIRYEIHMHPETEVVCERFTITMSTAKKSQAPFSLEMIGNLKQIMRDAGMSTDDLHLQSPSDAKGRFSNESLKKLGYWHRGGAGHALDSMRHGLLYLTKQGWVPTKLLAD